MVYTGFFKKASPYLILIFMQLAFSGFASSQEPEYRMECVVYGVQTVDYVYTLKNGEFFIQGERARDVTSPNKFSRLVLGTTEKGNTGYTYASIENAGGHALTHAHSVVFKENKHSIIVNDMELDSDCQTF